MLHRPDGEAGDAVIADGANLAGANLAGAHLTKADLTKADLTGATLTRANPSDVNLSCSSGVIWAQVGPIGIDRRTLTGVWHDDKLTLHAGCFHGSLSEFLAAVDDGGPEWDWPDEHADLQAECREAAWYVQRRVHAQLAVLAAEAER